MSKVTEDTPVDLLEGNLDLTVILPDKNSIRINVSRKTPIIDLLVQVTTAHKINPGGHIVVVRNEFGRELQYKPSTPIGSLDTTVVEIVPKNQLNEYIIVKKQPAKMHHLEHTFRLQVHLPRNQLYVMRVGPKTLLQDILEEVCAEKNLDLTKYEMRHPINLDEKLLLSSKLGDYGLQQVRVVSKNSRLSNSVSSADILALQQSTLDSAFKYSRSSVGESSVSSESAASARGGSPSRSDDSRSISPLPQIKIKTNLTRLSSSNLTASQTEINRKKRAAPPPPSTENLKDTENSKRESVKKKEAPKEPPNKNEYGRHFSTPENPTHFKSSEHRNIERSCSSSVRTTGSLTSLISPNLAMGSKGGSVSNLTTTSSTSNTSLASSAGGGRNKRKAPKPPTGAPILLHEQVIEEDLTKSSPSKEVPVTPTTPLTSQKIPSPNLSSVPLKTNNDSIEVQAQVHEALSDSESEHTVRTKKSSSGTSSSSSTLSKSCSSNTNSTSSSSSNSNSSSLSSKNVKNSSPTPTPTPGISTLSPSSEVGVEVDGNVENFAKIETPLAHSPVDNLEASNPSSLPVPVPRTKNRASVPSSLPQPKPRLRSDKKDVSNTEISVKSTPPPPPPRPKSYNPSKFGIKLFSNTAELASARSSLKKHDELQATPNFSNVNEKSNLFSKSADDSSNNKSADGPIKTARHNFSNAPSDIRASSTADTKINKYSDRSLSMPAATSANSSKLMPTNKRLDLFSSFSPLIMQESVSKKGASPVGEELDLDESLFDMKGQDETKLKYLKSSSHEEKKNDSTNSSSLSRWRNREELHRVVNDNLISAKTEEKLSVSSIESVEDNILITGTSLAKTENIQKQSSSSSSESDTDLDKIHEVELEKLLKEEREKVQKTLREQQEIIKVETQVAKADEVDGNLTKLAPPVVKINKIDSSAIESNSLKSSVGKSGESETEDGQESLSSTENLKNGSIGATPNKTKFRKKRDSLSSNSSGTVRKSESFSHRDRAESKRRLFSGAKKQSYFSSSDDEGTKENKNESTTVRKSTSSLSLNRKIDNELLLGSDPKMLETFQSALEQQFEQWKEEFLHKHILANRKGAEEEKNELKKKELSLSSHSSSSISIKVSEEEDDDENFDPEKPAPVFSVAHQIGEKINVRDSELNLNSKEIAKKTKEDNKAITVNKVQNSSKSVISPDNKEIKSEISSKSPVSEISSNSPSRETSPKSQAKEILQNSKNSDISSKASINEISYKSPVSDISSKQSINEISYKSPASDISSKATINEILYKSPSPTIENSPNSLIVTTEISPKSLGLPNADMGPEEGKNVKNVRSENNQYRYSGPPSIQMGTWGERPRSGAISLKSDTDYIMGMGTMDAKAQSTTQNSYTGPPRQLSFAQKNTPAAPSPPPKPGLANRSSSMYSANRNSGSIDMVLNSWKSRVGGESDSASSSASNTLERKKHSPSPLLSNSFSVELKNSFELKTHSPSPGSSSSSGFNSLDSSKGSSPAPSISIEDKKRLFSNDNKNITHEKLLLNTVSERVNSEKVQSSNERIFFKGVAPITHAPREGEENKTRVFTPEKSFSNEKIMLNTTLSEKVQSPNERNFFKGPAPREGEEKKTRVFGPEKSFSNERVFFKGVSPVESPTREKVLPAVNLKSSIAAISKVFEQKHSSRESTPSPSSTLNRDKNNHSFEKNNIVSPSTGPGESFRAASIKITGGNISNVGNKSIISVGSSSSLERPKIYKEGTLNISIDENNGVGFRNVSMKKSPNRPSSMIIIGSNSNSVETKVSPNDKIGPKNDIILVSKEETPAQKFLQARNSFKINPNMESNVDKIPKNEPYEKRQQKNGVPPPPPPPMAPNGLINDKKERPQSINLVKSKSVVGLDKKSPMSPPADPRADIMNAIKSGNFGLRKTRSSMLLN